MLPGPAEFKTKQGLNLALVHFLALTVCQKHLSQGVVVGPGLTHLLVGGKHCCVLWREAQRGVDLH